MKQKEREREREREKVKEKEMERREQGVGKDEAEMARETIAHAVRRAIKASHKSLADDRDAFKKVGLCSL